MRTVLISLYPLSNIGGGERYTLDTIRAIQATGDECSAYAIVGPCLHRPYPQRLTTQFVRILPDEPPQFQGITSLKQLMAVISQADAILVHQYLSSDTVFDLIANCASDQIVILTNLGHEPLRADFQTFFQPSRNCWFAEISEFSAKRARRFSEQARAISGALWRSDVRSFEAPRKLGGHGGRFCSVGRILAHKGIEMTIAGIPKDSELFVVGPKYDKRYWRYIKSQMRGKKVVLTGALDEARKREIISQSDALIASSHHNLYDGRIIEQAELLGLVIFEALALNTLPIASNIPPFQEVMNKLGLADLLYEASNSHSLDERIEYLRTLSSAELCAKLEYARQQVLRNYLWDNYWARVKAVVGL